METKNIRQSSLIKHVTAKFQREISTIPGFVLPPFKLIHYFPLVNLVTRIVRVFLNRYKLVLLNFYNAPATLLQLQLYHQFKMN